jgi:hypothetical protein
MAKFKREELRKHGLPYDGYDGVEIIGDNIVDHSRWSVDHELIFRWTDGKYYETSYSVGATEMQDERPWEYDKEVECQEVRKVTKTIEVWEAV